MRGVIAKVTLKIEHLYERLERIPHLAWILLGVICISVIIYVSVERHVSGENIDWDWIAWLFTHPFIDFFGQLDSFWLIYGFICGSVSSLTLAVFR